MIILLTGCPTVAPFNAKHYQRFEQMLATMTIADVLLRYPVHLRIDGTISMKFQSTIARRFVVHHKVSTVRKKLGTG
jgi:hypothetical protein